MSDSLLSTTIIEAATIIGQRLPAAYAMEPGQVLVNGDAESHPMPEGAAAIRWALGDDDGHLVLALTPDAVEVLAAEGDVVQALSAVVDDIGMWLAPLFDGVPPMVGVGEEVAAPEALATGFGDAVSVTLDDAGTHRATLGLRLVVTDQMLEPAPADEPAPAPQVDPVDEAAAAQAAPQAAPAAGAPGMAPAAAPQAPGIIGGTGPAPRRATGGAPLQAPMGEAHPAEFSSFDHLTAMPGNVHPMSLLGDVEMGVTAELGRTELTVRDVLSLTPGAIIELDRAAGSPVDVVVNGTLIARGEVVVIDEEFGIRITEIVGMPDVVSHLPVAQ